MSEPRIVFAAVVGYTDRETADHRILSTPESFRCPVDRRTGFPLPVIWTPPNHHGKPRQSYPVGRIEEAYVVDRRIIVFGHLITTEEVRQGLVPMLAGGAWVLEIDIDSKDVSYDLDPDPFVPEPVGPVLFTGWTLRAAHVGPGGVWDLPPVQIEELTA